MSKIVIHDLMGQFEHALVIFNPEVGRFYDGPRVTGCLKFYCTDKPLESYPWGTRFGGGWWELKEEQLPKKETILASANEIEEQVMATLSSQEDEDLLKPTGRADDWGAAFVGHLTDALRHTAHYQGQLASLASCHGHQGGSRDL